MTSPPESGGIRRSPVGHVGQCTVLNEANQEPPVDQTHQGGTGLDSRGKGKGRPSGSKSSRTQADEEDEEGPGQDVQDDGRCVHMSQVFFFQI